MVQNRLLLMAAALLFAGAGAHAQDSCTPVETAPGIKSVPAGCNKFSGKREGAGRAANPAAQSPTPKPAPPPTAKPSALFPGVAPGSIVKYGNTEIRFGGQVRVDYGYGR